MAFRAVLAVVLLAAGCRGGDPASSTGAAPTKPCPTHSIYGNLCTNKTAEGFIKCTGGIDAGSPRVCTEDAYGCVGTDFAGNMRPFGNCTFLDTERLGNPYVPIGRPYTLLCYGAGGLGAPDTDCPPGD
jgi:hypothetical protein